MTWTAAERRCAPKLRRGAGMSRRGATRLPYYEALVRARASRKPCCGSLLPD